MIMRITVNPVKYNSFDYFQLHVSAYNAIIKFSTKLKEYIHVHSLYGIETSKSHNLHCCVDIRNMGRTALGIEFV
jgi:predicted ATP-dependent Lon-type protease